MKIVVSHLSPDLDSITASWLVIRFWPGWHNAEIKLVPAGSTLNNQPPDQNPDIIHVDTGLGRFDHHQTNKNTCATKKVFLYLLKKNFLAEKHIKPLERMVEYVNLIDHFQEINFPQASNDIYEFCLHQIIIGLKSTIGDDVKLMKNVFIILDGIFQVFKNKISAEEDLNKIFTFTSKWGKSGAIESKNEEIIKLALKSGFNIIIIKDPKKGNARIKTRPDKKIDLTPLYQKIKSIDKKGTWFLHISKNMLLNSSSKNPHFVATPLSLSQLVEITKSI